MFHDLVLNSLKNLLSGLSDYNILYVYIAQWRDVNMSGWLSFSHSCYGSFFICMKNCFCQQKDLKMVVETELTFPLNGNLLKLTKKCFKNWESWLTFWQCRDVSENKKKSTGSGSLPAVRSGVKNPSPPLPFFFFWTITFSCILKNHFNREILIWCQYFKHFDRETRFTSHSKNAGLKKCPICVKQIICEMLLLKINSVDRLRI